MNTFLKVWIGIALLALGFGIGVVVLAAATGDYDERLQTYSINESYDDVQKIDMNIGYGEVDIMEGDTFSIEADHLWDDMESYVSDGTWYIEQESDSHLRIFGVNVSLGSFGRWDDDFTPKITITVPEGFEAESFILNIGAGSVEVEAIRAMEGEFTVEAGRLVINELSIPNKSTYDVGAGEMILKDVSLKDITMDSGVGSVVIEGDIFGDNDITCGVGSIELDLNGDENDYSYDISSGIGNVEIDGRTYHSVDQRIDNGADNYLRLDCGIGHISVDFN